MSIAARASWIIERNLFAALTLADLAEACGVSRFHLAHAFGEATGRTVMRHLRSRRLSEAAKALAAGAPDILDLALTYGYGSHEAFSRAFLESFGMTPEAVRRRGTLDGLALVAPLDALPPSRAVALAPLTVNRETVAEPWIFVGLPAAIAFEDLVRVVPGQWARFMPRLAEIENIADPIPCGVARGVDEEGRLDYCCAVRVKGAGSAVPKGLVRILASTRHYATVRHEGHVSRLGETYDAIWRELPARSMTIADRPFLERHAATFDPRTGEGGIDVWVPLVG